MNDVAGMAEPKISSVSIFFELLAHMNQCNPLLGGEKGSRTRASALFPGLIEH